MTKKYKIGTCYSCQKCLYCGVNLKKETCTCKKMVKPTRANRISLVKYAYSRAFDPNSNFNQLDYIKIKNELFEYGCNFSKSFQFSLCSACNSSYQRLAKKKPNNSSTQETHHASKYISQLIDGTETIDLESTTSEISHETMSTTSIIQSKFKYNNSNESETEDIDDVELEIEINYKLVIKQADGNLLPAKNYSVTITKLDEFLLAIQSNITILLGDNEVDANDYNISFKSEKAQGVGTSLLDMHDFENFKSEYIKLIATKKVMLILVIMKKKSNAKRKNKESNSEDDEISDKSIPKINNNNKIPKISDISLLDQRIAKNVTELRKETWCPMHNRYCLKECDPHIELSNMMFSIWATEMLNGLATVKEPPTHPLFTYTHSSKNRSQLTLPQTSNDLQNSFNPFFSNFIQALITPNFFQQSSLFQQSSPSQSLIQQLSQSQSSSIIQQPLPSMAEFLQQLDEIEETGDYYFKFLEGFDKQRIKIKHLYKLSDMQFEACGVTTIGDVETIREAAKKYK
ncbi:hypothetical protein C1645_860682 [Glomus cerebriforme]|uniref:SAM domain-containing protein n=1 Tax=Glomus cerebriforme TaxID=658196 RepID=A0A397SFX1_9GLOM|nr:hypothetical protein C1645_860682 [Glomus cerebriforme]